MLDPKKAEVALKRHFARVTPEEFRKRAAAASHGDTEGKPAKPAAPPSTRAVAPRPRPIFWMFFMVNPFLGSSMTPFSTRALSGGCGVPVRKL